MKNFYVYMYLRCKNSKNGTIGSPYYVGKGKGSRAFSKDHRCKPPLDLANIVFVARDMTEWDAHQLEMLLIHHYGRIDNKTGCLANLTDGGEGFYGFKPTQKHIAKLKATWASGDREDQRVALIERNKNMVWTDEIRQKVADDTKKRKPRLGKSGQKHSEETKAKMKVAQKDRWDSLTLEQREFRAVKLRKKQSAEVVARKRAAAPALSLRMKGLGAGEIRGPRSEETKARISATKRANPLSEEKRKALSDKMKGMGAGEKRAPMSPEAIARSIATRKANSEARKALLSQ